MSDKRPNFPFPHFVDHRSKHVYIHVASGWPTVMAVPIWMKKYFYDLDGYKGSLCSKKFLDNFLERGPNPKHED